MAKIGVFETTRLAFIHMVASPTALFKIMLPIAFLVGAIEWFSVSTGRHLTVPQILVEIFIAFYWHRYVLLRRGVTWFWGLTPQQKAYEKRVSKAAFSPFLWRSIGFSAGIVVSALVIGLSLPAGLQSGAINLLVLAFAILLGPILFRLALVFPATAMGKPHRTFGFAWDLSQGNGIRITAVYLVAGAPLFIVLALYAVVIPDTFSRDSVAYFVDLAVSGLAGSLGPVLWASINSAVYKQLDGEIQDFMSLESDAIDSEQPSEAEMPKTRIAHGLRKND